MTFRLLLSFALVAQVLVLVTCTANSEASSSSSGIATSQGSSSSSYTSAQSTSSSSSKRNPKKCHRVKKCPKNEEFSYCPQTIGRIQNCSEKGERGYVKSDNTSCKQGCVCKESYLRAQNGTCIPADQCEITCRANEVLDNCPADCDADYCPTEENTESCNKPEKCPPPACKCQLNYRRNYSGDCIPTKDCPPFDCSERPNEEYNSCPPICPTDDCSQASSTGECPKQFGRIGIVLPCNPTCRCIKGYWRLNGTCVPYGQCPNVCPSNEEWSECAQATCRAQNCTEKGKPIACPLIAEGSCIKACVCKEGYLRDKSGDCIPQDECPSTIICGENEVVDSDPCPSECSYDYCPKWADENEWCIESDFCEPACKCKFNYRRADNGTCIPTKSCPPFDCSEKLNEEYNSCPPYCPTDDCSLARVKGICPYKIGVVLECDPKCQCKDGYGRVDGICKPFSECPNLCPTNEEYSSCIQATCRPQVCADRDDDMSECPAVETSSCERGCVCQKGYYRNDKGDCISYEQCGGPLCPWPNEHYTKTMVPCPPNICRALVSRYICDDPQVEEPGCLCDSGYLRPNLTENCIPICDCPEMAGSPDC